MDLFGYRLPFWIEYWLHSGLSSSFKNPLLNTTKMTVSLSRPSSALLGLLLLVGLIAPDVVHAAEFFNRVATYHVCEQLEPTCNIDTETVAEIAAVSKDGNTVVYTDGPMEALGK